MLFRLISKEAFKCQNQGQAYSKPLYKLLLQCMCVFRCYTLGSFHRSAKACSMIKLNYRNNDLNQNMALCCSQLLGWRDLIKGGTCLKNVRTTGLKKNICKKKKSIIFQEHQIQFGLMKPHETSLYVK